MTREKLARKIFEAIWPHVVVDTSDYIFQDILSALPPDRPNRDTRRLNRLLKAIREMNKAYGEFYDDDGVMYPFEHQHFAEAYRDVENMDSRRQLDAALRKGK